MPTHPRGVPFTVRATDEAGETVLEMTVRAPSFVHVIDHLDSMLSSLCDDPTSVEALTIEVDRAELNRPRDSEVEVEVDETVDEELVEDQVDGAPDPGE